LTKNKRIERRLMKNYKITVIELGAVILAVATSHQFKDLDLSNNENCVVYDIKSVFHTSDGKL